MFKGTSSYNSGSNSYRNVKYENSLKRFGRIYGPIINGPYINDKLSLEQPGEGNVEDFHLLRH